MFLSRPHNARQMNDGARFALGASLTMAAALGINRFAYTPLLPPMLEAFGLSLADAGDIASANYAGYALGALLAPRALRSSARHHILSGVLAASALSTALGAWAQSYGEWMLVRFISGVASAYCLVLATAMLGQVLNRTGEQGLGNLHFTGVGLGICITAGVAWIVADLAVAWMNLAAVAALLMIAAWRCFQGGLRLQLKGVGTSAGANAPWPLNTWLVIAAYGFFGYGYVVSATFLVTIARLQGAAGTEYLTWLAVGAAAVPSVWLWQRLAAATTLRSALIAAYIAETIGVLIAGYYGSLMALAIAGSLLGGTFAAITALGLSYARATVEDTSAYTAARVVGHMTVAFALGQWIGPALSGRLAEASGGFLIPSLVAAAFLAAGTLLLISCGPLNRSSDRSA